jgi:hypothetical protein
MLCKKIISIIIVLTYLLYINSNLFAFQFNEPSSKKDDNGIKVNREYLKKIIKLKEENQYQPKELPAVEVEQSTTTIVSTVPETGLTFKLPHQSSLNISGRKLIGMKYGVIKYADPEEAKKKTATGNVTDGFDMNQELQVRIKGKVGRKIDVNVDYDDTVADKRDISVVYTGYKKGDIIDDEGHVAQKDEIIQEVAFGDINLSLPSTEFVGYNKKLFGIRMHAKYNRFNLTAIGSRTKGITETKKFTGNTTFEKKDVRENTYIRRKYYKIYFDAADFENDPITAGSVVVYLDNKKGPTGKILADVKPEKYNNSAVKITDGSFVKLDPGVDYSIDYIKGIIVFNTSIDVNYIIAIDYTKKSGKKLSDINGTGAPILIKDENESDAIAGTQEIKSYYRLGDTKIIKGTFGQDFIVKILNSDRTEVPEFSDIYNKIEVDFDSGLLKFKDDKPFNTLYPDIYGKSSVSSKYIIYTEYYHRIKTYTLRPSIVVDSERILINNKVLKKDTDYIIDYDIGFVTFLNEDMIDRNSVIEITYEYMPFGGQYQQTLAGIRTEYNVPNKGHLGTTVIYSGADKGGQIPSIDSTPSSVTIFDGDGSISLAPNWLPVKTTFQGEAAQSVHNPNVAGKAMIDNMEGIKIETIAPTDKDSWQVASNPNSIPASHLLTLSNTDMNLKDINPNVNEKDNSITKIQTLDIGYTNLDPHEQTSIVYPISNVGMDFSKKDFLEVWIYSDETTKQNQPNIKIRYGCISENADGQGGFKYGDNKGIWNIGDPKTEDINGDGTLNIGEDIGWDYITPDGKNIKIGSGNGKINSEDLDGDGKLDIDNFTGHEYNQLIDLDGNVHNNVDWTGWKKFVIPLNIGGTGGTADNWTGIKDVRITLENTQSTNVTGSIKMYGLNLVGNKWDKGLVTPTTTGTLNISAINSEDDPSYTDLLNSIADNSDYQKLYSGITRENVREQAMLLAFDSVQPNSTAYTKYIFPKEMNFSKYKELKFFLYGYGKDELFFIQYGTDDNNYFEYTAKVNWSGWQTQKISLKDTNIVTKGTPNLNSIKQIKFGIRNSSANTISGKIIINDIYVDNVIKKTGNAYKSSVDFTTPGWFDLGLYNKYIDRNFETINSGSSGDEGIAGTSSITSGQDITTVGGNLNFKRINFLPFSVAASKTETITPSAYQTNQSIQEEGYVLQRNLSTAGQLLVKHLPTLSGGFARSINDSKQLDQRNDVYSYDGSFSYSPEVNLYILPKAINGAYKRINRYILFGIYTNNPNTLGTENKLEITDNYSLKTDFSFFDRIDFKPSYSLSQIRERKSLLEKFGGDENWYNKSNSQNINSNLSLRVLNWFTPNFSYSLSNTEDYNLTTSTDTGKVGTKTKNITRSNTADASLSLDARSIFPNFSPVSTLNMSGNYKAEYADSWENIDAKNNTLKHIIIKSKEFELPYQIAGTTQTVTTGLPRELSFSNRNTLNLSNRWKPFSPLFIQGMFSCIPTLTTTINYTAIDEQRRATGTPTYTTTKIWPDILGTINKTENLFFIPRYMQDSELSYKYSKKETNILKISNSLSNGMASSYRFKFIRIFDCSLEYGKENSRDYSIDQNAITKKGYSKTWATQFGMQFGVWRFTPRYENLRAQERDVKQTITSMNFTDTASIQTRADFNLPTSWRMPFFGTLHLSNRFILDSELKLIMQRSDINVETDRKNTYSFSLSGDYELSSNLRITLGGKFSKVKFLERPKGNYYAFEVNAQMSIVF